jgi:hypothetical protein
MASTDAARIRELLLDNLFAVFNVRDAARRSEAIARNYTEDVTWTDPDGTTQGHAAMNERAQTLLDGLPEFVFSAADAGGERLRRSPGAGWKDRHVAYALDRE